MGSPPSRLYRPVSGAEDFFHTLVGQAEQDSLAALEAFFDRMMSDPEMQALMAKWDEVDESHEMELCSPIG